MNYAHAIRERVAELNDAARVLADPAAMLGMAVRAIESVCPERGAALAFVRALDGSMASAAALIEGTLRATNAPPPGRPTPWIVDIDRVPAWQQNTWIEPMRRGVHGPGYFTRDHPVMQMIGMRKPPDYGRMMLCQDGRLLAWIGLYVPGRQMFHDNERAILVDLARQLVLPLRLACAFGTHSPRIRLAPRQHEIVERVARGWTNKRIAKDLDIAPATVKTLLERLFRVSGAANRAALVQWWRDGALQ
jgi:DNA-binding CsgD family transcriptional regulator